MAANDVQKDGYPPEIIGYAEPWIVAPGDLVAIKVRIFSLYSGFISWRQFVSSAK